MWYCKTMKVMKSRQLMYCCKVPNFSSNLRQVLKAIVLLLKKTKSSEFRKYKIFHEGRRYLLLSISFTSWEILDWTNNEKKLKKQSRSIFFMYESNLANISAEYKLSHLLVSCTRRKNKHSKAKYNLRQNI